MATLNPRTDEARGWLAKRASRKVYVVTVQTSGPRRGRAISESDIVQTRIVGVAIPAARRAVLDSRSYSPATWIWLAGVAPANGAQWMASTPNPYAASMPYATPASQIHVAGE